MLEHPVATRLSEAISVSDLNSGAVFGKSDTQNKKIKRLFFPFERPEI